MKKLFIVALAAFGMVACMNEEITELPAGNEITFDNAFIDNATRAELTADNMSEFKVWGYIDGLGDANNQSVVLFEGESVTRPSGTWQYGNGARYWAPGEMHYFEAVAPTTTGAVVVDAANGKINTIEYNMVDGESDLIYAAYSKEANEAGQDNGAVSFTFNHLLSRVMFTFENNFAQADGITLEVRDVKMSVPAKGEYNFEATEPAWSVDTSVAVKELAFAMKEDKLTTDPKFVLPYGDSYAYAINFVVDVKFGGVVINTVEKSSTVMVALAKGNSYNFKAVINAESLDMETIEFSVEKVESWGDDAAVDGTNTATVSTPEGLMAAFGNAQIDNIILTADINLNDAVATRAEADPTIAVQRTVTLDLNGKTLSATSAQTGKNYNMFDVRGNLTVKNGNMVYEHNGENMGWNNYAELFYVGFNGTLNLNGVTVKNLGGSDMAYVIDMVNATNITLNVENSTLESTYIPIRVFNNSKTGVNNVSIKKSTLEGKYCFWVQYWLADGRDEATLAQTLNLNIFNSAEGESNDNTFVYTNDNNAPVLYGFNEAVYFDEFGKSISLLEEILDAEGKTIEGVGLDAEGNYVVTADEGMTAISELVAADDNGFAGKTIKLADDVDLTNVKTMGDSFAPIGSTGERDSRNRLVCEPFKGTFDGNGKKIKGLKQSGWDMGYEWGQYGSVGLFAELESATVKNVTIEGLDACVEGGDISFIAGSATGDCVFEDITITDSTIGTYNNGCGGIIGWSGDGTYTFKNITIGEDVVLGGLWGSFDSSIGGIVGQAEPGATYIFENVTINCRIDAYNDCTASYDYYNYRMCGMIIGRCEETTTIDGRSYPDLSKYNMTFNNVTVNYGTWMNYHYCEPTPGYNNGRGMRIEAGYAYDGLPADFDHNQCVDNHYNCIPFDQLVGGAQIGVRGLREVDGVTVNYPEEYTCPLCGEKHNTK